MKVTFANNKALDLNDGDTVRLADDDTKKEYRVLLTGRTLRLVRGARVFRSLDWRARGLVVVKQSPSARATAVEGRKAALDKAYQAFIGNPSAARYVNLETAMLAYQNEVKN